MKSEIWWYAARSAGVLAWVLSAASVVWGLLLASPSLRRRADEASVADLHRFLGGLASGFLAVHLLAVLADSGDGRTVGDVLVPFGAGVDRVALGLGWLAALALVLVLVEVTSLLRGRLADVLWRRAHYAGFAVFVLATVHGAQIGTDADAPGLWWPAAALAAAVVGLVAARLYLNGAPLSSPTADVPAVEIEVRPGAALLERTLEGLRNLDDPPTGALDGDPGRVLDEAFPVPAAPTSRLAPPATPEPVRPQFAEDLPPRPLTPDQAVSGSLFPSARELGADPGPGALDLTVPTSPPAGASGPDVPTAPTARPVAAPSPAPVAGAPVARPLPVRTPRRLARTTSAAETIDAWRPTRVDEASPLAPPAPPTEIDPATGEPDPQAYRKWLREWLAYVESQA